MMMEFQSRQQELVTAIVNRIDPKNGAVSLEIGHAEAVLMKSEQVPGETFKEGDHIKVYIVEVKEGDKGPRAMISRTHPGLVKRLFEMEVPEIYDGTVEIKAVSREDVYKRQDQYCILLYIICISLVYNVPQFTYHNCSYICCVYSFPYL